MKQIEDKKYNVHGYIKGDYIVLHHMDFDHEDENGKILNHKTSLSYTIINYG